MDAIDRKILAVLQEDSSLSVAEVGSRVGLSSTPCWKRIQKLEAEGVIQKRVAVVDPEKIGLGVTVFVAIETGDHSEQWLGKFADVRAVFVEHQRLNRQHGSRIDRGPHGQAPLGDGDDSGPSDFRDRGHSRFSFGFYRGPFALSALGRSLAEFPQNR